MDSFHDIYRELQVVGGDQTGYRAPRAESGPEWVLGATPPGLECVGSVQVNVYWVLVFYRISFSSSTRA